jgi:hypothetical protein
MCIFTYDYINWFFKLSFNWFLIYRKKYMVVNMLDIDIFQFFYPLNANLILTV